MFRKLLVTLVAALSSACGSVVTGDSADDGGLDGEVVETGADADADVEGECGNGTIEGREECDDGNDVPGDGCERDCTFSCHGDNECEDTDPCTQDLCAAAAGGRRCVHPVAVGHDCDDGNACTTGEICGADGACGGGTPVCTCVQDSDCAPYEDGDLCNGTLVCRRDTCVIDEQTIVTCPPTATPCRRLVCNPDTGHCDPVLATDGTPCDDGRWCTLTDACAAGECVGAGTPCPEAGCVDGCDESGDRCSPAPVGTVCRAAVGPCDVAETCSGSSTTCPGDAFRPSSYVCRAPVGPCDRPENCTGSSAECPADAFRPVSHICRPSTGYCDPEERCSGSVATCPEDSFLPDGTGCDDGDATTYPDVCERGRCVGLVPAEVCNHLDDDHDGHIDEGVPRCDYAGGWLCPLETATIPDPGGTCGGGMCRSCTCGDPGSGTFTLTCVGPCITCPG